MTLESKLRALVARWRGATKAFSADGASRPLEWEGKDILRVCADELEALLAERQEPPESRPLFILRLRLDEAKYWSSLWTHHHKKTVIDSANCLACTRVKTLENKIERELAAAAPSSGTGGRE